MTLCDQYLSDRGISEQIAKTYGLELDERIHSKKIKDRLGLSFPKGYNEVLWFPIYDAVGNIIAWIARPLPTIANRPKFFCPAGSSGVPFIPSSAYNLAPGHPVIITEGPIKALACVQAGVQAIGLIGVWGSAIQNSAGWYVIRGDLQNALDWRGRKVYFAFDADLQIKADVRQALFRAFFILSYSGAETFQLTNWDLAEAKGIDDYLVKQLQTNGQTPTANVLQALLAGAKPFIDTVQPTSVDLGLVTGELQKVALPKILREQLLRPLVRNLGVKADSLQEICNAAKEKPKASFAADYELWSEPVDAEEVLNEIMVRVNKEVIIHSHQALLAGLEIMLTWVHPQMDFSPIFYVTGPDRECGKTSLLEVMAKMVRRPVKTSSVSPAAIFRLSELYHSTFLMDECQDQLQDPQFCQIIKAGHTPGDVAIRCDPNTLEPLAFDAFCPKILAGIGRANGQIMSRSIIIEMERKNADIDCHTKIDDPAFVELRRKLARWANDCGDLSGFDLPKQPSVKLRSRNNWQVYYRVACAVSKGVAKQLLDAIPLFRDEEQDFATYLLSSIRKLYQEAKQLTKDGFIGSETIVEALNRDQEAPWFGRDNAKGLSVHTLSARLRRYKVKPDRRYDPATQKDVRGYCYVDSRLRHNDLKRLFEQYLPTE